VSLGMASIALSGAPSYAPSMPSSRRAQIAECAGKNSPAWCSDVGLGKPSPAPKWQYGDWTVELLSDQMDVDKQASIRATLFDNEGYAAGSIELFIWNGGKLITHQVGTGHSVILTRKGWPFCERNLDRIAVDDQPVQYLATIKKPGHCDFISPGGSALSAMKNGQSAKLRLTGGGSVYRISLSGFTKAMNKAVEKTER